MFHPAKNSPAIPQTTSNIKIQQREEKSTQNMDVDMELVVLQELLSSSSSSSASSSPKTTSTSSSSSSSLSLDKSFSETFSDDDFFEIYQLIDKIERKSVKNFADEVVDNYTDDEFRQHFRVPRQIAITLSEQFAASRFYKRAGQGGGRKAVPAKTQCLSFLWFAANRNTYREVAQLFNLSLSSAYRHQTSFLAFLEDISKEHVKMPTTDAEKEEISKRFQRLAGMPDVIGTIEGCCINIRNPAKNHPSVYKIRGGQRSITLQAICDSDNRFRDVFAGASSKLHKSEIFAMSEVSKQLPQICESKYHILGSAAYPIREYLLTPYRDDGTLSPQQEKFNLIHAVTVTSVINSFKLLKQRFRQLSHLDFFTVSRMSRFVLGCCILHNMCIECGDFWFEEDEAEAGKEKDSSQTSDIRVQEDYNYDAYASSDDNMLLHNGLIKRDIVTDSI